MSRLTHSIATASAVALLAASVLGATAASANGEPAVSAPTAPYALALSAPSDTEVAATWAAPTSDGGSAVTDYVVQLRAFGQSSWQSFPRDPSPLTEATANELNPAAAYAVRVAAVNGAGTSPWSTAPTTIDSGLRASGLAGHTCAVVASGAVRCWGSNTRGQLGNGTTERSNVPVPVADLDGTSPSGTAVAVDVGESHSCAVLANGGVVCWGDNGSGQLGDGTTSQASRPVHVIGLGDEAHEARAVAVTAGGSHTCALLSTGAVQCWGRADSGQLGLGSSQEATQPALTPATVIGLDGQSPDGVAISVSAGFLHTCAVLATGAGMCWGFDEWAQLGDGSSGGTAYEPTPVSGLTGAGASSTALSVSAGYDHSCVVTLANAVKCWGSNARGQLGTGSTDASSVPVNVVGINGTTPATSAVSVSVGQDHTCAVLATGTIACWGSGTYGQLGNGDPVYNQTSPVAVADLTGARLTTTAVAVAAGSGATCAVLASGASECWGDNEQGQLGNSSFADQSTPAGVSGLTGGTPASAVSLGHVVATQPAVPGVPSAVAGQSYSTTTIELSWSAPENDGGADITDYALEYRVVGAPGELEWVRVSHQHGATTTTLIEGLTSGATYAFRVAAITAAGQGAWSEESASVRTLRVPGTPGTPVIVSRTSTSITIRWSEASANGSAPVLYDVQYRAGSGSWSMLERADSSARTATATGLRAGSSYTFRVRAVTQAGWGAWSAVSAAAVAAGKPGLPGAVTASPTRRPGQLLVTWTASAANGAPSVRYEVAWRGRGDWSAPVRAQGRTYLITGLTKGVYAVRVTAITVEGSTPAIRTGINLPK